MEGIQTFKGSWPWPWLRAYGMPSCITHRPLPIYQISFKSKKLFVDGRTDVRTDGHFFPLILLGRLLEVDLKSSRYNLATFATTKSSQKSTEAVSHSRFWSFGREASRLARWLFSVQNMLTWTELKITKENSKKKNYNYNTAKPPNVT